MDEKANEHAQIGRMTSIDAEDEHQIEAEESEAEVDRNLLGLLRVQFPTMIETNSLVISYNDLTLCHCVKTYGGN